MQIIIDIDEDDYKLIKDGNSIPSNLRDLVTSSLFYRIRNGKLLPKRHGRLIDADELDITTITTDDYSGNEVLDIVLKEDVDNASTIVEADKE